METPDFTHIQNSLSKIQLERLSHVHFQHEDLEAFEDFAADFGLVEAWKDQDVRLYRGYGEDPYCYVARKADAGGTAFHGPAFIAQTENDFQKAAAMPGAEITDLAPYPGGGRQVTLKSPSGFPFHVVFGQTMRTSATSAPTAVVDNKGPLNASLKKQRLGEFQRFHAGPALVHKLGHLGYIVGRWDEELEWYTSHFNLIPSDIQYVVELGDLNVITFMHLDLGERYSDHHCLFLARGKPGDQDRLHHTSYEVEDFDTQLLGHQWLADKNYKSVWGVGRHILGSQIFDYWKDTSGFIIEHYTDGDVVNVHNKTVRSVAGPLAVWGPEIPKDFSG